jgi:hypothetical protein
MNNMAVLSISELETLRDKKIVEKMKLDKFFSMFLDSYGEALDVVDVDHDLWKLYKNKLKEYQEIDTTINRIKFNIDQKCLKTQTNFRYT